jgi:hypothetical protein
MHLRHPLLGILGFTALIINPAVGCGGRIAPDDFTYGETEMVAAVQGTWRVTFLRPEGPSIITFTMDKGAAPSASSNGGLTAPSDLTPHCGARTFVRPAAACIATSQLALAAVVVEAEPPLDVAEGQGWFFVGSLDYTGGHLQLKIGPDFELNADLDASNAVTQSWVKWRGMPADSVLFRDRT